MGPLRSLSCRVFLELFSGSGHMASRMSSLGGAVLMWDISFGPAYDLSRKKVQQLVRGWILAGMVWAVHMGTPCTTFCRFFVIFNRRCSRTTQRPEGDGTFDREVEGNKFLDVSCRIINVAMQNKVWWTLF